MSASDLARRADATAGDGLDRAKVVLQKGTTADLREAKRILSEAQRELREIKREASEAERQVKLSGQEARARNAKSGQIVGLFMDSRGKSALARGRAAHSQSIAKHENAALQPYRSLRAGIDRQIDALTTMKERCDAELDRQKGLASKPSSAVKPSAIRTLPETARRTPPSPADPAPPPHAPQLPPPSVQIAAGWYPDPTDRHELRYWGGTAWTEHVADGGRPVIDPI
jgi:hypothetical protein